MSGIGPKAEVDDHALLGFDPRVEPRQAAAALGSTCPVASSVGMMASGGGIARTSNDQSRDQGPCRGKSRCFEIECFCERSVCPALFFSPRLSSIQDLARPREVPVVFSLF